MPASARAWGRPWRSPNAPRPTWARFSVQCLPVDAALLVVQIEDDMTEVQFITSPRLRGCTDRRVRPFVDALAPDEREGLSRLVGKDR